MSIDLSFIYSLISVIFSFQIYLTIQSNLIETKVVSQLWNKENNINVKKNRGSPSLSKFFSKLTDFHICLFTYKWELHLALYTTIWWQLDLIYFQVAYHNVNQHFYQPQSWCFPSLLKLKLFYREIFKYPEASF